MAFTAPSFCSTCVNFAAFGNFFPRFGIFSSVLEFFPPLGNFSPVWEFFPPLGNFFPRLAIVPTFWLIFSWLCKISTHWAIPLAHAITWTLRPSSSHNLVKWKKWRRGLAFYKSARWPSDRECPSTHALCTFVQTHVCESEKANNYTCGAKPLGCFPPLSPWLKIM